MSTWTELLPHFQRPTWLWALLALPLPWWWWHRRRRADWRTLVDAHLLPHLLVPGRGRAALRLLGVGLAWTLAVLALAGPGWRQEPRPRWVSHAPLVVALDLGTAMRAPDLPPTRLAQARAKLEMLLRRRQGGEMGLVVWAEDAFTVAPLTADAANLALFLDALEPEVMPADGHRPDRAIAHAALLLRRAGFAHGDILLLTDRADAAARQAAAAAAAQGYRVSVLGMGTAEGGVYRDRAGTVHQARLEEAPLRALAAAGAGRYARLAADEADLRALGVLVPPATQAADREGEGEKVWLDQGYWLLLPLLALAALGFRRGAGVLAVLPLALAVATLVPAPAWAAQAGGQGAGSLWRRPDQQAQQQLERGVEAYRRGDYAAAAEAFAAAGARGAQAHYNLGNALARQGRYDEAIAAYDRALALDPGLEDAAFNRRVVEAARRQPPGGQGGAGSGSRQDRQDPGRQDGGGRQAQDGRQDEAGRQARPPSAPRPEASPAQDAARQAEADRAQRERMEQALRQAGQAPQEGAPAEADPQVRERRQAHEAWLRRVPDDPGGLLRAKFQLEHERRQREGR